MSKRNVHLYIRSFNIFCDLMLEKIIFHAILGTNHKLLLSRGQQFRENSFGG